MERGKLACVSVWDGKREDSLRRQQDLWREKAERTQKVETEMDGLDPERGHLRSWRTKARISPLMLSSQRSRWLLRNWLLKGTKGPRLLRRSVLSFLSLCLHFETSFGKNKNKDGKFKAEMASFVRQVWLENENELDWNQLSMQKRRHCGCLWSLSIRPPMVQSWLNWISAITKVELCHDVQEQQLWHYGRVKTLCSRGRGFDSCL